MIVDQPSEGNNHLSYVSPSPTKMTSEIEEETKESNTNNEELFKHLSYLS